MFYYCIDFVPFQDSKSNSNKPSIDQSEQGWDNTEGDGWDEDWKGIEEPEENVRNKSFNYPLPPYENSARKSLKLC